MNNLKQKLATLHKNLNILREREARYAGNAPLDLLNQIEDHQRAIALVQAAIQGEITPDELEAELLPLNLAMTPGPRVNLQDVKESFLAIGNGAKLIVNQALSAAEEAHKQKDYERAILAEAVKNVAMRLQQTATLHPAEESRHNPYKALLDYRLEDAPFFYGRDQAIHHMFDRLERSPLTILHAESGAGKTSLLQAGIAPRLLIDGHLPLRIRAWNLNPTLAIKRAILPHLEETPGLAQAPLADFLRQVTAILGDHSTLYIFLDQFEEFFTQLDEAERSAFVDDLAACLEDESLRVRWVLAMRKEFFGNLATFRPRIRAPFANDYLLRAMTRDEARQVITQPAAKQGVTYEPALVDQILDDLSARTGKDEGDIAPPQIQLVCATLFEQYLSRRAANPNLPPVITLTMYQEEEGAEGILREHLHRVLRKTFTDAQSELARRVLVALISSDRRRRRLNRAELLATPALRQTDPDALNAVLEQLVDARLLRVEEEEESHVPVYELAHDYLLTEIEIDPEMQAQKAAAELLAREVTSFKRYGTLLSDRKYRIIHSQLPYLTLDEDTRNLLRQSRAAHRRRVRNRYLLGGAIFVVLLISSLVAIYQRNLAREASQITTAGYLAVQAADYIAIDAELSLLLGLEAWEEKDMTLTRDALRYILANMHAWQTLDNRQVSDVFSGDWSPDGETIALGLRNGDVQIWDAASQRRLRTLRGHTNPVYGLRFSPSGAYLVSAAWGPDDEQVANLLLWDVLSGRPVAALSGHNAGVVSVAWRPDGASLLSGDEEGQIIVWDINTAAPMARLRQHTGTVWGLAWSPDGKKFASVGENGEVFIWDAATLTVETRFRGHQNDVLDVAWRPGGQMLATAGADGTVRLWDIAGKHLTDVLSGHNSWVRSIAWHPGGNRLVSSSDDNRVIVWDVNAGRSVTVLAGHTHWVRQVVWSPDGASLLSASEDGTAKIWNMKQTVSVTVFPAHQGESKKAVWHPSGRLIASAGDDGFIRLWNPNDGTLVATLGGHRDIVQSIAWSPDGTRLASVSDDRTVRLWNTISLQNVATLAGHTNFVYDVAWSPDGKTLATCGADRSIRLWDVAPDSATLRLRIGGYKRSVLSVEFSPDGRRLAASSADGQIVIYDPTTGDPVLRLAGHDTLVWDVSFSPDGAYLASASQDATVRIWDAASGKQIAELKHAKPVNTVEWNSDGTKLVTASDDQIAYIWNVNDPRAPQAMLSGHQGGVWSAAWSPDDAYILTASTDGMVRIFHANFQDILELAYQHRHRSLTPEERKEFVQGLQVR